MSATISQLLPVTRIFQIAGRINEFEKWYEETYGKPPGNSILHGYKYFIEGCLHMLYDSLASETFARLQNDLLLDRAFMEWVSFQKLDNTCEKIILLKNIYQYVKPIKRAVSFAALQGRVREFEKNVLGPINTLLHENLSLSKTCPVSRDDLLHVHAVSILYLYFSQIANSSPMAHVSFLAGAILNTKQKTKAAFEGYKYALQFLWLKVLGKKKYARSALMHLHKADSWKDYIYIDKNEESGDIDIFGERYELSEQTCLDSYFQRIKQSIILPLERKHKLSIINLDQYWEFSSQRGRKHLKKLLNPALLQNPFDSLSPEDKIRTILYWFPLEVVDYASNSSFNGVSAFNTMLAGTVALLSRESQFRKCIACKFKHPFGENRNQYSYGILVDSKSAADHFMSGWVIYYDCCNDYSGFSSFEHKKAEELILQYQRAGKVELRELQIEHGQFAAFVANYIHTANKEGVSTERYEEVVNHLQEISVKNQHLWNDIKALILEWIAYYIYSSKYPGHLLKWNIERQIGEIDVFIETPDRLKLIECKINPNNYNLQVEISDLKEKALRKSKELEKTYDLEFWFWFPPSEQNIKLLMQNGIKYIVLSDRDSSDLLQNIDLSRIKSIMQVDFPF